MTITEVAEKAIEIYQAHNEAAVRDAEFDAGEFSGPAHDAQADKAVEALAKANGYTYDEVLKEIGDIYSANDGPYGRIS